MENKIESEKEKMLRIFNLDKEYFDGEKDTLYYHNQQGKTIPVLDVAGSYGINLLGHKNEVHLAAGNSFNTFPPNFIQGSIVSEKQKLSANLIRKLSEHTLTNNWICEFANTGTEIIEITIKLLLLNYQHHLERIKQEIYYTANFIQLQNNGEDEWKDILEQIKEIGQNGYFVHFENSFHGKTAGALSVMGNPKFKENFIQSINAISLPKNPLEIPRILEQKRIHYRVIDMKSKKLISKSFLPFIGVFLEPIQGEAGVFILNNEILKEISLIQKQNVPIVSDEIQCGLYRTGYFSALPNANLVADVYCFGKALGAGIAKISALCCRKEVYSSNFFEFHSSSFGEDFFSSWVANRFLSSMEKHHSLIEKIQSNKIYQELLVLQNKYPEFIKEVRGTGNMVGLEFQLEAIHQSFITKFIKDLNKLGYWLASVLLNQENIRIYPTLSNPVTFRIQPSLFFDEQQLQVLILGLSRLFQAITHQDVPYLFGHILPLSESPVLKKLPENLFLEAMPHNAAVFICHPINEEHVCNIVDLMDAYPENELNEMLDEISDFQDFTIYHIDKLKNIEGKKIEVVFIGIPLTSTTFYHALRSGKRWMWINKIQKAVDLANAHHAKSIGLGQFTSIITGNGMLLNSPQSPLTTGNAYTAALAIEAIQKTLQDKESQLEQKAVSIIGAGGNILSVIAAILSENCKKINLVFNSDYKKSKETRYKLKEFLTGLSLGEKSTPLKTLLNQLLEKHSIDSGLENILTQISPYLTVSSSIHSVIHDEIIIIGTNDTKALLTSEHVKKGAIIVDIAVPPNTSNDLQSRKDITYIKGGIAALPDYNGIEQSINSVILPFGSGECYACMAETFGMAFEENKSTHHIGDLSPELVHRVLKMMAKHGFSLKRLKVENSI